MSPSRRYVTEGDIMKVSTKGVQMRRYLFLLNDIVVLCDKSKTRKFKFKALISLATAFIKDVPDAPGKHTYLSALSPLFPPFPAPFSPSLPLDCVSNVSVLDRTDIGLFNCFLVLNEDSTYLFAASSLADKLKWIHQFNATIDAFLQSNPDHEGT